MNDFIYWLDQIQVSHRPFVGDKAFILSQLHQKQFPILPGFVISSSVFHQFLEQLDDAQSLLADFPASSLYLNVDNPQALQLVAKQSRKAILAQKLAERWLSSVTEAANQLNSSILILRVSLTTPVKSPSKATSLFSSQVCWNTPEALELALKKVWAGLFSSKSLFYWQRMEVGLERVNVAVLVQPIYNAIASGIVYIQANSFQVQASWGLGHSLLQGEVLPDIYYISSATGRLETQQLGNKTRGYRLKSQPIATASPEHCLEVYLLSQEEQENYCLNNTFLVKLSQLLQKLTSREQLRDPSQTQTLSVLEWTLTQFAENQEPNFYILQANFNLSPLGMSSRPQAISSAKGNSEPMMTDSQPILNGISASPGIIYAHAYVVKDLESSLETLPEGQILVTKSIIPDWLPWLKKSVGIIAEEGGMTSHAAIIARELGIPAIVSATGATELLKTGEFIQLDGDIGEVYLELPSLITSSRKIEKETTIIAQSQIFNYPIGTQLMVNLSQTSSIANAVKLPVDGVGLLRSDLMLLELLAAKPLQEWLHPSQKSGLVQQWSQLINQFALKFSPLPVFYRSLDMTTIRRDYRRLELGTINSILGERGTYSYRLNPILFDLELQALEKVHQLGNSNVNLILPFVRSVEEFKFCRHRVEQIGLTQQKSFQLWIMAEVPSVIFLLPDYVEAGVQGIAIGTNDLTQLLLGVDREQGKFSQEYNAIHPAMLATLRQLITQARTERIPCSICGQAPVQYPELIEHLINWGITSISVEPEAVEKTYHKIARAEQRLILEKLREK